VRDKLNTTREERDLIFKESGGTCALSQDCNTLEDELARVGDALADTRDELNKTEDERDKLREELTKERARAYGVSAASLKERALAAEDAHAEAQNENARLRGELDSAERTIAWLRDDQADFGEEFHNEDEGLMVKLDRVFEHLASRPPEGWEP